MIRPVAGCSESSSSDENDDDDGVEDTADNEADTDYDLQYDYCPCYIGYIRIKIKIICYIFHFLKCSYYLLNISQHNQ